jgi:mannobiose 2-epimerase
LQGQFMDKKIIRNLQQRVRKELDENIIPFWVNRCLDPNGGFIGRMTNDGVVIKDAPKGLILNTRLLWTFSALYGFEKKPEFEKLAKRAYDYIVEHFWDAQFGGVYWMLDCQGNPLEDKKQSYGQAFAIYALAEYYRAFRHNDALVRAKALFALTEKFARDTENGGYFESLTRDLKIADNQRLSEVDLAEKKSNNTHLHMFEAYMNLFDVSKNPLVGKRLEELLNIFLDQIIKQNDRTFCQLFFDELWNPKSDHISFGHDIEASWLLERAATILGNQKLLEKIRKVCVALAESVHKYGMDNKNSLFYEADSNGLVETNKDFWVQVEAVIGFINAYQLCGDEKYLKTAIDIWKFCEDNLVDKNNGEWYYKVDSKGKVINDALKVSEWKGPYHASRACIEIITRIEKILE